MMLPERGPAMPAAAGQSGTPVPGGDSVSGVSGHSPTSAARVAAGRAAVRVLRRLGYEVDAPGAGAVVLQRRGDGDWVARERTVVRALTRAQLGVLLRLYGITCVLDVGAHKGQHARLLRSAGYTGRIVSFEPVAEAFEVLRGRAAEDPDWQVRQVALGREDGVLDMRVVPGTLSSMLAPTAFGARRYGRLKQPETVEVPVRRLDGLLDDVLAGIPEPRIFLKLDTQGFDLEAFAGLGDRAADVAVLQSEVALVPIYEDMPRMTEALATYEQAGFAVAALYPVTRDARTARVLEYDCVLVRPSAARGARRA
jgi:FkbM family methyltransferase